MRFIKIFLSLSLGLILSQCSSQSQMAKQWQERIGSSTYNVWTSGAAPAGVGADFFVEFTESLDIEVARFEVNGEELLVEMERTESKMLIIGRKYTAPDPKNPDGEVPSFYQQKKFAGTLTIIQDSKEIEIPISSFEKSANSEKNM
jgi:hypothetical protein